MSHAEHAACDHMDGFITSTEALNRLDTVQDIADFMDCLECLVIDLNKDGHIYYGF